MMQKNKYGQYFTTKVIADFMTSLITHKKASKILEPACGKGVFLDSLIQQDFNNISAYEIDRTLETPYKFVKYQSFLPVSLLEKYDLVIGNPPYIRWKNLEPELKKELTNHFLWNKYFNSLCDYLFIFILKSIEHLNENGELIFICTDYWLNTTNSSSLRNYMSQNGYFSEIYHFKEAPLFEKVTASFIIFRYVKSKQHSKIIQLYKYNKGHALPTQEELTNRTCFDKVVIPQFNANNRWVLASQSAQQEIFKFEQACIKPSTTLFGNERYTIGDFCDIGNGMVSGLDSAFQFKNACKLNDAEQKALIPVIKAKDMLPYTSKSSTPYIFIQENITPYEFSIKYPNFAKHFEPNLKELSSRYSYNRKIPYWEFVFPRNQRQFERKEPRIFVPCKERISNKNYFRFCYAPTGYYSTQDVTAVFKKNNVKESLEYILAYLNNFRVFSWLSLNGIVKGDIVEFSEAPIASIPFRPINWNSQKELSSHNRITLEVQNYLKDGLPIHLNNINSEFNFLFQG